MPAEYPSDISTEHPFYQNNSADWNLVYAAFNGGAEFISADYLIQHVFESDSEFEKRISRAMYFNIMRRTLTQLVRLIMSEGVIRRGLAEFAPIISDATGFGTPWDAFWNDAGVTSCMYGNAHVIVDYAISQEDTEISTLKDVNDNNVFPTVELFTPRELINWRKKRRFGYEWCVFKTSRIVDDKDTDVYIKVDYENIQEVTKEGAAVTEPYAHGLGYTPVVDVPFPGLHKKDMQRGLGIDLAYVSKAILNLSSLTEEVAERHAFNQLTMPDDGAIEELQARQSDYVNYEVAPEMYDMITNGRDPVLTKLAKSTVMTFPATTGHPPGFISPDSSQLADIWAVVKDSIGLALYAAGINELSGKTDIATMAATLTALSGVMESAEASAMRTAGKYIGKELNEDFAIVYPGQFSIETFENWLKNFQTVAGLGTVDDDFKLSILRGMVLRMPGQLSQTDKSNLSSTMTLVAPEPEADPNADTGFGKTEA